MGQGLVHDLGRISKQQSLDAVPMVVVTPGPALAGVAFIRYLLDGFAGAVAAAVGIFTPCA